MKRSVLFAAISLVIANGIDAAAAAGLPTYETTGFPITAHQVSVIGAAHVQEAPSVPALTLGGMPASPSQIQVLTAHKQSPGRKPQSRRQPKSQSAMGTQPIPSRLSADRISHATQGIGEVVQFDLKDGRARALQTAAGDSLAAADRMGDDA